MVGRWASGPQPTSIPAINPTTGQIAFYINDPDKLSGGSTIDIYPGETEPLDIAARFPDDQFCYGWNNETYFLPPPAQFGRNPNWQLDHDRFLVKIVITSSGQKCEGVFQLINDVPDTAFRLEEATKADRLKVG
jgi:hypothetical protein